MHIVVFVQEMLSKISKETLFDINKLIVLLLLKDSLLNSYKTFPHIIKKADSF